VTLPIRRWLALALVAIFAFPTLVVIGAVVLYDVPGDAAAEAAGALRADVARWADPAWQAAARERWAGRGVDFVLVDAAGREIYRSVADPFAAGDGSRGVRRVLVPGPGADGAATLGAAYLYFPPDPPRGAWFLPLLLLAILLLTLGGVAWFLDRAVVKPLAATGRAARQIGAGDLAVALPTSRVREVAELNVAFAGMGAALRAALEQQAATAQERRLLIGAVVHDLRTPLFALRGYLDGLAGGLADTPEKAARYLGIAREKAATLERLIADLFEYTRLEYLEQPPRREPLQVDALLRRLVDGLQPQAAAKGVTLLLVAPADATGPGGAAVAGDPHLLTRAVENLLDNALRHTPVGGRIEVAWRAEPARVAFTVADTGPGIAPQDLPHLFTPLYRGETSRNRRTGGAGLGLTIARRILLAHGGDLVAANAPGGGARFTGTLARGARALPDDRRQARGGRTDGPPTAP